MHLHITLFFAAWALQAEAVKLYVATYGGYVTSFSLTRSSGNAFKMTNLSTTLVGQAPSWLTLDAPRKLLFAVDEGAYAANGSFSSYKTSENGTITLIQRVNTTFGPVDAVLYGNHHDSRYAALPIYGSAGLQTFALDNKGNMALKQNLTFTLPKPGPKDSQKVSRPHGVTRDPTGRFLIVPDLGADLVRVFSIGVNSSRSHHNSSVTRRCSCHSSHNATSSYSLTELAPIALPAGSGPRHAAFGRIHSGSSHSNLSSTLYVVSELSSTLTTYSVRYTSSGPPKFTQLESFSTFPSSSQSNLTSVPPGLAAGEVAVSPDGKFVVVSNRNDSSFHVPLSNSTLEPSDSLVSYKVVPETGRLLFDQFVPAGGLFPRMFRFDRIGSRIAVGCQTSNRTVILERNVKTGKIGGVLAWQKMEGPVGSVIWDE